MVEGEFEERMCAAQFELGGDVGAMVFDGAGADEEFGGDFAAGFVLGDELVDASFGDREILQRRLFLDECVDAARAVEKIVRD